MSRKIIISLVAVLALSGLTGVYIIIGAPSNPFSKSIANQAILIEGGTITRPNPQTGESEKIAIKSFYLDKNLTTVAEFDEFVKATKYVTEAHKFGNSAVFEAGNWTLKDGADYWYPFGKDQPKAEPSQPVTQVSWNDAVAYSKWKGKRLPTEVEWEYAATNKGTSTAKFPWGNEVAVNGVYLANVWQGAFPFTNSKLDGYERTSPVGAFPANALGFNDIGGNVWQWCSDTLAPTAEEAQQDPNPRHPSKGASFLTDIQKDPNAELFNRTTTTAETSLCHTGFRLAKDEK